MGSSEDFIIHVEGKTIVADKSILRKGSEYFRAMFDSNMVESRSNEATLQGQSYKVIKALVECMKTGDLEICDNIEELVEGATMLQIESAIKSCSSYLEKTVVDSNCLGLWKYAEDIGLDGLYNIAKRHSLYYFKNVFKHSEFLELSPDWLIKYLSEKQLNVESELNVLNAAELWILSNSTNEITRKSTNQKSENSTNEKADSLAAILECFHPEDLMEGEWEDAVKMPILKDTEAGRKWLELNQKPVTGKQYREVPVMILTVGGEELGYTCGEPDVPVPDICRFDNEEKCFKPYRGMSLYDIYSQMDEKMGYSVCSYGRYMYVSGGQPNFCRQVYELKVWRFDSFTLKWSHLSDLPSCRRHHGTCASETSYYVLGGFGKFRKSLSTFEEYHIERDVWIKLPNLPQYAYNIQVTKYKDKVFAFKGDCFIYDINEQVWTTIERPDPKMHPLQTPVCHNDILYCFPLLYSSRFMDGVHFPGEREQEYKVWKMQFRQEKTFSEVSFNDKFKFGSNMITNGRRFFCFQNETFERDYYGCNQTWRLLSGVFEDFDKCVELSQPFSFKTEGFTLVILPDYPQFKCVNHT